MSPPWTNLPYELVEKVFAEMDGVRDVLELQHICQTWRPAAQERLYSDISIPADGGNREQFLVQTLCIPDSKARYCIKRISVELLGYRTINNFTSLVAICSLCPNVVSISMPRPTRQFYRAIYQLRETQHLQKLQCIAKPSTDCIDDYSKLVLLLKSSATEINVYNDHTVLLDEQPLAIRADVDKCIVE